MSRKQTLILLTSLTVVGPSTVAGWDEGGGWACPLLVLRRAGFTGMGDSDLLSCWPVEEVGVRGVGTGSPVGELGVWGRIDEAPSARGASKT